MGRESQSRQIGDVTFIVTQLGFVKERAVLSRLGKLIGGAVGTLAKGSAGFSGLAKGKEMTAEEVAPLIAGLLDGLSEQELKYFCDEFATCTVIEMADGKQSKFNADAQDLVFTGHIERMFLWFGFCMEVNFNSFFDVLKGALAKAPSQKAA